MSFRYIVTLRGPRRTNKKVPLIIRFPKQQSIKRREKEDFDLPLGCPTWGKLLIGVCHWILRRKTAEGEK